MNEDETVFGLAVIEDMDEKDVPGDRNEIDVRFEAARSITNDSNIEVLNVANLQPFPTVMHPQNHRWDTSSYSRSSSNSISITATTATTVNTVISAVTHDVNTELSNDLSIERQKRKKKQKQKKYENEKRNEIILKLSSDQKTFLNAMMRHSLLMIMLLGVLVLLLLIYCGWIPFLLVNDEIWLMVNEVLVLFCTVISICMMYFTFELNVGEYERCCSVCDVMLFDCCEGIPQNDHNNEHQQYYVQ